MTGGRLGYRTNGNEIFLDDMTLGVEALGVTLDVVGDTLRLEAPRIVGSYDIGTIRYSGNPLNHGHSRDVTTGDTLPSYGSISGAFDFTTATDIKAGGRSGEGLRIDHETTINSAYFIYHDAGNALALREISGYYRVNDLRLDVTSDWQGWPALGLTLGAMNGEVSIGAIEIGGGGGRSLGEVNVSFLLEGREFEGRHYTNTLYLQGGGHSDAGGQGLRLATEWSLKQADLSYTEDGNRVIFSGLQSWGRGDVTVNVTRNEVRNGTRFYDGLRIGFEGIKAGYRINGLRVGNDDAPLQGGTELLLPLGFYPAFEFEVDGHMILGAGGASGEGLTINSDVQIRNGKAALTASPYDDGSGDVSQKGLWLSDLSYDGHIRDMTVDVTEEGLAFNTGESWSTLDVGNLRLGDKDSGQSFGRFVVQKYETGSGLTIVPGGSGEVCARGVGATASAGAASGGRWKDRGDEGITVRMKQILAEAVDDSRKNAFTWETSREIDGSGQTINGTGTRLVLNDIHSSDGGDFDHDGIDDNTFGVRTDVSVDVYQARVVNLVHPVGGARTAVYGVKMQNFDIKANLTATPIP